MWHTLAVRLKLTLFANKSTGMTLLLRKQGDLLSLGYGDKVMNKTIQGSMAGMEQDRRNK
jgi:hypothetical protein